MGPLYFVSGPIHFDHWKNKIPFFGNRLHRKKSLIFCLIPCIEMTVLQIFNDPINILSTSLFSGEDVSTLVILLAFLKILLAATPMVALSLLWKWTEGPPKSDTIQQKDRLLSKNSLSYNTPEDVHVDSPSPYPWSPAHFRFFFKFPHIQCALVTIITSLAKYNNKLLSNKSNIEKRLFGCRSVHQLNSLREAIDPRASPRQLRIEAFYSWIW